MTVDSCGARAGKGEMNVIAIDWSGASDGASKIWLAEVEGSTGRVIRLEGGRSRAALGDYLIAEAKRNPNVIVRTDAEVPSTGGIRPESVFQIGGAGAVGTGSLRGMPLLKRLRCHPVSRGGHLVTARESVIAETRW